ncbi:hypothetical protein PFICI_02346 [Pestalotiopsis fici W106-1]|uniref:Uncharacterized protein n=1 Tax=Pestalotiopsis fici (strain W106-1 / CGMCC3.15140) TaxID=1229662 RepID=W3XGJ7_PESFW|nr:uncharacterized protein PFICI_02346 [Pestalotiopsis fici W106-1]ETS84321.1 hypothetical protein PFICI_02346 [Pestalotiopsis fici W106-1]
MGKNTASASTVLPFSREQVYDFVSNPHNWPLTYKGSGGIQKHLQLPLKLGDKWTEKVSLAKNTYYSEWTLITAIRPSKFVFEQVNGIGALNEELEGGVEGTTKIEYVFDEVNMTVEDKTEKGTLFTRTFSSELPRGVEMPEDLLVVCMRTVGIEGYHDAVARELAKTHTAT